MINATVLLSAWSAAASDIYISSRFLFFLARRGHAPKFFASLTRYPPADGHDLAGSETDEEDSDEEEEEGGDIPHVIDISFTDSGSLTQGMEMLYVEHNHSVSAGNLSEATEEGVQVSVLPVNGASDDSGLEAEGVGMHASLPSRRTTGEQLDVEAATPKKRAPLFVLPLRAVFGSASVGLLCFLGATSGATPEAVRTCVIRRPRSVISMTSDFIPAGFQLVDRGHEYRVTSVMGRHVVHVLEVRR